MLMLPIILWWADAPLRFSTGRPRTVVSIVCVVALMAASSAAPRAVAGDRFGQSDSHRSDSLTGSSYKWRIKSKPGSDSNLIREGTQIPVINGQILMMGRRWAFLPNVAEHQALRSETEITEHKSTDTKPTDRKPWVLVENLMLQRIVESLRADSNDDLWSLSGEITEFLGENRMAIQTAQRSNLE